MERKAVKKKTVRSSVEDEDDATLNDVLQKLVEGHSALHDLLTINCMLLRELIAWVKDEPAHEA
jgi:hypothetical protein